MRIEKRIGAALTASALAFGLIATPLESVPLSFGAAVSAQEKQEQTVFAYIPAADMSALPDSRELEEAYINSLFYGGGFSFYKDYGKTKLSGQALDIYNTLRTEIEKIAEGNRTSTTIDITFTDGATLSNDLSAAVDCLLVDLPASLYWYDKTKGIPAASGSSTIPISFTVAEAYAAGTYEVNPDKITAAKTAVSKAQSIAAKYANETAYKKVLAFRDEICALTEYNYDALAAGTAYGDPWQLVWVFDDSDATKVVCEGYSKAFQYLCDLSGIECYTVSGKMGGGTGAGDHMWNIVVLDDVSYLVDITNCDGEKDADIVSVGYPDKLLLKGADTSSGSGCTFNEIGMTYTYDAETHALYDSAGILTVSEEDYDPDASGELTGEISIEVSPKTKSIAVGETFEVMVAVTATDDLVGVEGGFTFDFDEDIISLVYKGEDDDENSVFTVEGLAEGSTDLTIGWIPTGGVTLEDGEIADTCEITVTAAECEHEYDEDDWTGGETGHWHVCTICYKKLDVTEHDETAGDNGVEADCTTDGREADTVCSVCGYLIKEGEVIPKKGHTPGEPKHENVEDASCTVAGSYDEVVRCEVCNEVISSEHKDGEMLPHDMAEIEGTAKAPTCAEGGKEADKKCKNCDHTEEGKVLDATGEHTMVNVPDTAEEPTCAEPGKEADKKCSVCGLEEAGKAIPATGEHTAAEPVRENVVAATCTKEGSYDEVTKCEVCKKILDSVPKTIEKIPHTPGDPAKENDTPATCTKDGSYDMVTKCTVCGEISETEHTVVPALGHDFGSVVQGETTHYQECSNCGTKVGEAAHTKDGGTVTTAPTEENNGVRTYSCTVCGKVLETETIPALGENHEHSYTIENSDASNHWIECVCGDKDSVTPHTTDTKEEIALAAVCNVDGLKYVVTYCTDCGREISRNPVVIPKTGVHTPGADYGKDSSDHWNTCKDCGTVVNKEPHTAGPAATETTPQTCTVCGYEMAPVLAHTHTYATTWTNDDRFHWHAATCQHTDEVSGMAVHEWDGGVITTEPTETSKGVKTFTCTVCAATKTEPVSELAHTHTPSDAWKFDITGHWHVCGSCDEKLDFAAHNEVSEVTKAPAATIPGTRRYYCSICRYVIREEAIPATGVVDPVYPSYPAGSTIVFPPTANTKDPVLDGGSGKSGWKNIADDIRNASSGDAVYVDMNGTTTLSKTALKELMGKNVDLVLEMGEFTWTINGETVTKASDVNMKAKLNTNNIPNKIIEALSENGDIVQVSLSHSGSFGFDAVMTVYLGTRYNGKYANLMYCNSKSGTAEYIDCSLIVDGKAALDFTHASEYAIVISDEPMGEYEDVSAAAEAFENGVNGSPAVYVSVLAVLAAAMVIFRKKAVK